MHDLRLVGVHEDGEHLLLSGPDDEQYLLAVDEPLRAAVRRDRAHLGQLQIEMSGDLRPREVQAQIRAGASAEEVAERSGWPLDRVRRYEGAVLAEREHITNLARNVTLRRRGSDATPPTLSFRVEQRLTARGVDTGLNHWDSARAEDGPWMLTLRFAAGGREREARWLYDPAARTVTAQDDEALWLSEDEQPPAAPMAAPHLAAVPTVTATPAGRPTNGDLYDVEAEGGMTQPETVTLESPSAVDLVGAMRQRRHGRRRQTPAIELPEGPSRRTSRGSAGRSADSGRSGAEQEHLELEPLMFDPSLMGDPPVAHPFPFPERLRDRPNAPEAEPAGDDDPPAPDEPVDRSESAMQSDPEPEPSAPPKPPRSFAPPRMAAGRPTEPVAAGRPAAAHPSAHPAGSVILPADPSPHRRARRASVPSWDEIMFGGKRD
jgi:Protein of unknown function (DUF3071)